MTKTFNCSHDKPQPRCRVVCEWCAVEWRMELDSLLEKFVETDGIIASLTRRMSALGKVAQAAMDLRASGYDGPFSGEAAAPLLAAIAALEKAGIG